MITLEICVETAADAAAAAAGGADRIELCAGLGEGGTTPSGGTISETRRQIEIPLVVLIRPRRGDFCYSPLEFQTMLADVKLAASLGADGVAVGVLRPDGAVHATELARLVEAAGAMTVTFHRAFDLAADAEAALETLVGQGVDRVLTSGQASDVMAGLARLQALSAQAAGRIAIMPGGGVRPENVAQVVKAAGVREIHGSASSWRDSPAAWRPDLTFDAAPRPWHRIRQVSAEEVARYRAAADSL